MSRQHVEGLHFPVAAYEVCSDELNLVASSEIDALLDDFLQAAVVHANVAILP